MKIVVTGGAGFVGSNLVRLLLEETRFHVVNLDLLTYAGSLENLADLEGHPRYRFVRGDICDAGLAAELVSGAVAVVNAAAESHVDRSITNAAPFVRTNVMGTQTLLAAALDKGTRRFVQVSTDEVYGTLPWADPGDRGADADSTALAERFTEETPLAPRSPYSASKAGADLLALAYHETHGLDVVVTRCTNNYGPYQFPEKLVSLTITRAMEGKTLPLYGDGLHVREWMHVRDHCRGIVAALEHGRAGQVYNFGSGAERTGLWMMRRIVEATGADPGLITHVEDRPGHDRRYAVDATKAKRELDWMPKVRLEAGLQDTVAWYAKNRSWWQRRAASGQRRSRLARAT